MASPAAFDDLASGFLRSEGYVSISAALSVDTKAWEPGFIVSVTATEKPLRKIPDNTRVANSSCGLCGVQTMAEMLAQTPRVPISALPGATAIHAALSHLRDAQTLNRLTHAVHGAAWALDDGSLLEVREDIGRHNALDKLLGAQPYLSTRGFVLVTSRLSYEMVQKAAMHGVSTLIAISAPTSLAIRLAEASGMNLVAIARDDSHEIVCEARPAHG